MSMHSRSDPTPRAFRRIQKSRMAKGLALLVLALAAEPASIAGVWRRSNTRDCDADYNPHGNPLQKSPRRPQREWPR